MPVNTHCIHQQFCAIAGKYPENTAVVQTSQHISFHDLDIESDRVAAELTVNGEFSRSRVAVYMSAGIGFITAALGILKTGATYVPLDVNDPAARTLEMIRRIKPAQVITHQNLAGRLSVDPAVPVMVWKTARQPRRYDPADPGTGPGDEKAGRFRRTGCDPAAPAYIIHTSGSTGIPKGIPISHQALDNLLNAFNRLQPIGPQDRCALWSGLNFDVSVYEIWSALVSGATLFIPDEMIRFDADAFIAWLTDNRITSAYIPPFMIADLARSNTLPASLKRMLTGVSAIPAQLLYEIRRKLPGLCLINGYGPAEATVCATLYQVPDTLPHTGITPIGKAVPNLKIYLLDPEGNPVEKGEKGEICIAGIQVADGYVKDPLLSAQKFVPNPFFNPLQHKHGTRMYKTGDLGVLLDDGNLMFSGRIDFQIKYKGVRIEPGEIEKTITSFPGVSQAAVVLKNDPAGKEILAAYLDADPDKNQVMEFLGKTLPRTMLPDVLIPLPALPQTSQGKIDRNALAARNDLPPPVPAQKQNLSAPQTDIQKQVKQIWEQVLQQAPLSMEHNFLLLGGDSIAGVKILSRVNQAFGTNLALNTIFTHPVLKTFARHIEKAAAARNLAGQPDQTEHQVFVNRPSVAGPLPLLEDQNLIWLFENLHPGTPVYHIPLVYAVQGTVDPDILKQAAELTANRHMALNIVIRLENDHPCQIIRKKKPDFTHKAISGPLPEKSTSRTDPATLDWLQEQVTRTFDLENGPLFRTALLTNDAGQSLVCFVFHHIVFDGWSAGLFIREFSRAYAGLLRNQPLTGHPLPETTFFDHVADRLKNIDREWEQARPFFTTYLKNLPITVQAEQPGFETATHALEINTDHLNSIRKLAVAHHTTPFTVLLLVFQLALFLCTREKDQVTGIAYAGRDQVDTEHIIGFFMNTLVVRNPVRTDKNFIHLLEQLKGILDTLMQYRHIPFHRISRFCREQGHSTPCFNALFLMQTMDLPVLSLPDTKCERLTVQPPGSNIDITLELYEKKDVVTGWFKHNTKTFSARDTADLSQNFFYVIGSLMKHPDTAVEKILDTGRFGVSPMQHAMLMETLRAPQGAGCYVEQVVFDMHREIDLDRFTDAWNRVIACHKTLCLGFAWKGLDEPEQFFAQILPVKIEFNDWSRFAAFEKKEYLDMFLKADRRLGFSLDRPPAFRIALIKTDTRQYTCVWSFHHCIADGRSMAFILQDLFSVYQDPGTRMADPGSFRSYITWLNQQSTRAGTEFWTRYLKGFTRPIIFPFRRKQNRVPGSRRQQHAMPLTTGLIQKKLSSDTAQKIITVCKENDFTLNAFLMGAWAVLLSHYTAQTDILFGATVSVRNFTPGPKEKSGLYINTLPVRIQIDPEQTLVDLVSEIRKNWENLRRFQHMSLAQIHACSPVKGSVPLSEIYFSYDYHSLDATITPYKKHMACAGVSLLERTPAGIFLTVQGTDELLINIEYDQRKFTSDIIEQILSHFEICLTSASKNPDARLMNMPVLTRAENDLIAQKLNTRQSYPKPGSCIHHLFEIQASLNREVTAVEDSNQQKTYSQLNGSANRIARFLMARGAAPEKKVLVFMEQTADTIALLLGILKSGCCYIPVDQTCPEERLRYILADAEPHFIATTADLWEKVPKTDAAPVFMDKDQDALQQMPDTNPESVAAPEHAAYIIYTSGSTGAPKGVVIEHASLISFTKAAADLYEIQPSDRVLQFASISFDASVEEIFPTLYSGATLVIKPQKIVHTPSEFFRYCAQKQITVLDLPTAYWHMIADSIDTLQIPETLRLVIIGGEEADPDQVRKWRLHVPGFVRLLNTYGPTETTVAVTIADLGQDLTETGEVPIGRPFPNVNLCILNHFNQPPPPGVAGELHIGGAQTARGYLNQKALTRQRFIPIDQSGQNTRFFKTRDLVMMNHFGQVFFKGRMDRQIKIRGFRVEPGEIEKTACLYPRVKDCAVTVEKKSGDHIRTTAFIVQKPLSQDNLASDQTIFDLHDFKSWLCARLPDYMCPSAMAVVKDFPRTTSGKIDYQALEKQARESAQPLFDTDRDSSDAKKKAVLTPFFQTDYEKRLKTIWENILAIRITEPDINFFDAGGSSLAAIRLVTAIEKEFKVSLPVLAVFRFPVLTDMAGLVEKRDTDVGLSSVEGIKTTGDNTPVFFVAGTEENTRAFGHQDLNGHPFYRVTVFAHKTEKNRIIPLDMWQIARQNVEEIIKAEPSGPYIIIGFCRYAVTAFEICAQLTRMGKTVEKLVLIDEFWQKKGMSSFVGHHIKGMFRFGIMHLLKKIIPKTREKIHMISLGLDARREKLYAATGKSLPETLQFRLMEAAFWKAYETYIPMPYQGDVIVLDSLLWNEKFDPQLRTYVHGNLKHRQVTATHREWFDPDQIKLVIQCLKK
ncbi:MAG: amino acid adenylation domain-containing protein [Desulfotignum sp.]|nr:amino acid adenylation domain-containing protein [Desulfotignum sp.]